MRRLQRTALAAAVLITTAAAVTAIPAQAGAAPSTEDNLDVYTGTLDNRQWDTLRTAGLAADELGRAPVPGRKAPVEVILGRAQADRLVKAGVPLARKPETASTRSRKAAGPTVFRPYHTPGGIREELATTAARFPKLAKLETIGTTVRGIPIQAVKVTRNARTVPDGRRPAVLYFGGQHAREWITPEMTRRLMHHVLDSYGTDPAVTGLVDTTELWFLPVANPDGYDLTFTSDEYRYWRKNMRDNNGDGRYGPEDGIDLNRNFAERWGYDNEGSSPEPDNETYRGPAPQSEPETRAMDALFRRVGFEFLVNYHSAAQLILWGAGWQVETVSPDDQIAMALAGDDARPAVPGYDPDITAELYVTNGDTNHHAQVRMGTIGFAPEMSTCQTASDSDPDDAWRPEDCRTEFDFPDDEKLIQAEVAKNIPFALSLARSARNPADPVSVVGRSTRDFVPDTFPDSFGTTQQVAVVAKRSLRNVRLHARINGRERTAAVTEWQGGQRYGGSADRYFAELRGTVTGQKPGDRVTVWFTAAGGRKSAPFTYTVNRQVGGDVLVLATEDVTGIEPANTDGATAARYAGTYVDALKRSGHTADVYDMDTHGRQAPHPLGVLSHYRAVVWETGDDIVPRNPGQPEWATTRATFETDLAVRDYLNEGGKLLQAGQYAQYAASTGYFYLPQGPGECGDGGDDLDCQPLSDDFRQYWLGAGAYVDNGGSAAVTGTAGKLAGFSAPAGAQQHTAAFLSTSSELPAAQFPQFTSTVPMVWQQDGPGPYDPADGDQYLWSGRSDSSYKRLTRTVDLRTAQDAHLRFKTSFDTDQGADFLIVEAHEVGTDNWTTLPDTGGLTSTDVGWTCEWERLDPHPFLAHYWAEDCTPHGSTGDWNAATGNSGGWKDFQADLSAYAGKQVEISISSTSDWYVQGYGVFLDDVRLDVDGATVARTSFETDLGGWTVAGPPPGSAPNPADWTRAGHVYDFGAATATPATLYFGFGPEKLTAADRTELLSRSMRQLLK
ncbi:M14 family zinc carboxypeptidase [Actinoplanes sp. NPDC048791]|uniref:M14 family metallopeptidase n=1 Tax=Actinoplanes sp. NPDC048791 TaxID=3154623 RepID=UPI0033FEFF66